MKEWKYSIIFLNRITLILPFFVLLIDKSLKMLTLQAVLKI